jgi:hypothetical protein
MEGEIDVALKRIQESMENGAFNNLDPRLSSVEFRTADVSEVPPSNNSTNVGNPSKNSPPSVPVWIWVMIGIGIALLNGVICFLCFRRRKEGKGLDGDEDNDEENESSGDNRGPEAAGYQGQGDDDYYDESDDQRANKGSGDSYRPSLASYSQRVGGDANETMQMMNSIGNL